ncbi:hypothetical protein SUGI_0471380 [Cryptomeria japonica]|nr:hypothetical protein SUGI_0471380 [Cryptomeria japonica]
MSRVERIDGITVIPCGESDGLGNLEPAATALVLAAKPVTMKLSEEIEKEVERNEMVFAALGSLAESW